MIPIKALLLSSLLILTLQVYRSSDFKNLGIDVADNVFQQIPPLSQPINTVCKTVNLTQPPYDYNGTVRSGYLKVGKGNSALSFIFYGREHTSIHDFENYPVLIWLNGGPGSSSQLGNFLELGPFWLSPGSFAPYEINRNPHSWVKQYSVLFVDQPVGTGLSFADGNTSYCKNMTQVADDFYKALRQLYLNENGCFHQLGIQPSHSLYIFGQSYGGKYAPAIAEKIVRQQQDNQGFLTGLKGVAIGDGFTQPYDILSEMGQFSYNMGLLDYQERGQIERVLINSTHQQMIRDMRGLHLTFEAVLGYIQLVSGNVNVYDITKYHNYRTDLVEIYLRSQSGIQTYQLNRDIKFNTMASNVYEALYEDFMRNQVHLVEQLLHRKVHVLIYNGQNDLIVETPGTMKWAERLHYQKAQQWRQTLFSPFKVNNRTVGSHKHAGNLGLFIINNAGHLVPMDQGQASLAMVQHFVNKTQV